jgi:all-trans-retinol 13,14-reductase
MSIVVIIASSIFIIAIIAFIHFNNMKNKINNARSISSDNDSIITEGFSSKKIESISNKIDCIVIGSGISGLTTASLLARRGKKVLVLEQHDRLGGATHTFTENGYEFDTGIHYIGADVTNKFSLIGFIFHCIGLGDIKWSKLSKIYDTALISNILSNQPNCIKINNNTVTKMEFTDDLSITINNLINAFPSEKNAIHDYFRIIKWSEIAFGIYMSLKVIPMTVSKWILYLLRPLFNVFLGTSTHEVLYDSHYIHSSSILLALSMYILLLVMNNTIIIILVCTHVLNK